MLKKSRIYGIIIIKLLIEVLKCRKDGFVMIKAFLSHSSRDKDIVRKIKNKLTRVWTYFDEDCFEAGEDFRDAIVSRIETSNVFVLFASKNSLSSDWVKYELDEIYWQRIKDNNIDVIVLTLDDVSFDVV